MLRAGFDLTGGGQGTLVSPDPFAVFAQSYVAGKLAEVDRALGELDGLPNGLEHTATRRRLVELRAQLVACQAAQLAPPA